MVEEKVEGKTEEKKISSGKPNWMKMKPAELEKIVVELAEKGESPEKIGMVLRDKYGVPRAKVLGKKITQILKEKGVKYGDEQKKAQNKVVELKEHISKNKHDYPATRALTKKLWVLHWLGKKG